MIFTEFLLQGEARLWWKMEKDKREGKDHLWKEFQELFLRRYFPISVHERKRKEFLYLTQDTKSVMEYDKEFTKLSRFARSLVATEKDRVERFVNGLKMSLQKDLAMCELHSHAEALDKALKVEWVREQMNSDPKKDNKRQAPPKEGQEKKKGKWEKDQKSEVRCERCGRNHDVKDCHWTTGACFRCGDKGHKIADCPQEARQKQPPEGQKGRDGNQNQGRL